MRNNPYRIPDPPPVLSTPKVRKPPFNWEPILSWWPGWRVVVFTLCFPALGGIVSFKLEAVWSGILIGFVVVAYFWFLMWLAGQGYNRR